MTIPSVKVLIKQATQLVTYLGDKHRFRLKLASAQEAIAAMYGHPNWNTLHGLAKRDASTNTNLAVSPAYIRAFPLTWAPTGQPQLVISSEDWYRHTLASGGTLADRQAWLQMHFLEHMARGGAGVFINVFGGASLDTDVLPPDCVVVNLAAGTVTCPINIMADIQPDEIAAVVTELMFANDQSQTTAYWKSSAFRAIFVVADALKMSGKPISFQILAELFAPKSTTLVNELLLSLPPEHYVRKNLSQLLFENASEVQVSNTWSAQYARIYRALTQLAANAWASCLCSTDPNAVGLATLLNQNRCVIVECPNSAAGLPEIAVLYAMRGALLDRYSRLAQGPREPTPWMLGLCEVNRYLSAATVSFASQGRCCKMAMLLTAATPELLNAHAAGAGLLDNVWNTLHIRGCSPAYLANLFARSTNQPVLVQPTQVTACGATPIRQ